MCRAEADLAWTRARAIRCAPLSALPPQTRGACPRRSCERDAIVASLRQHAGSRRGKPSASPSRQSAVARRAALYHATKARAPREGQRAAAVRTSRAQPSSGQPCRLSAGRRSRARKDQCSPRGPGTLSATALRRPRPSSTRCYSMQVCAPSDGSIRLTATPFRRSPRESPRLARAWAHLCRLPTRSRRRARLVGVRGSTRSRAKPAIRAHSIVGEESARRPRSGEHHI